MTQHDIKRAHALWLHLKQAHKDLTEMVQVWRAVAQHMEPEAAEAALDCATRLELYVATWQKPLSEEPALSVESVPAWAEQLASEWERTPSILTRECAAELRERAKGKVP